MTIHKPDNCIAQESVMHKPATYIAGDAWRFQCQHCHVQTADRTPATCVRHPPSLVVARVDLFLRLLRARVCVFYFNFFLLFLETRKESPNNELIRRTDDREDWKAMIADVCNRLGTWWWWWWWWLWWWWLWWWWWWCFWVFSCHLSTNRPSPYTDGTVRQIIYLNVLEFVSVIKPYIFLQSGLIIVSTDSPIQRPRIYSVEDGREALWPLSSIPVHPTFEGVSEIVNDIFGKRGDDDGYDLNFIKSWANIWAVCCEIWLIYFW